MTFFYRYLYNFCDFWISTKKIIDQYQKTLGDIDLWRSHYEVKILCFVILFFEVFNIVNLCGCRKCLRTWRNWRILTINLEDRSGKLMTHAAIYYWLMFLFCYFWFMKNLVKLRRHRIGEGGLELDDLSFQQLRSLEEDMVSSIAKIRERKV